MSGNTPLIVASCLGNVDVVKLLLSCDSCETADLNREDEWGMTALDCARENGFEDVMALLGDAELGKGS